MLRTPCLLHAEVGQEAPLFQELPEKALEAPFWLSNILKKWPCTPTTKCVVLYKFVVCLRVCKSASFALLKKKEVNGMAFSLSAPVAQELNNPVSM